MELLQYTATLPRGCGQWNSCNARAHQLGRRGVLPRRRSLPKERTCRNALPQCLGAVGSATPATHCLTARGLWAVELLQYPATPPGGCGQWNSCNARTHQVGRRGACPGGGRCRKSGPAAMHCHNAWGQWALELVQRIASLPRGSGQCNSCKTLPHRLGTVGSGTLAMHGPTSWGDGESCPRGGCSLKSATLAMHCLTAWGQWAVQLLPGVCPRAWRMGSPAQVAVTAYGSPAGDGSLHRRGRTSLGDGESCLGGGRCLWSAYGGRQPPSAHAH